MIRTLRAAIIALLVLGLALPFVYTPATTFPFVFGKGIFFSIVVEIAAALYVLLALVSPTDRPRRSPLLLVVGAYMAALSISTLFAFDPDRAFWGNHERMSGLFIILHFFGYYAIARSVLRTKKAWYLMIGAFVLSSAVMGGIAVAEHFSAAGLFANQPGGRVWATLGNYIYLGVYMTFAAYFAAYLVTETRSRALQGILVAIGLFDLYVLLLTESRAALLSVIGTAVVTGMLIAYREKGRVGKIAKGITIGILVLAAVTFLARETTFVRSIPGVNRLAATSFTASGDRTRLIAWEVAIEAWKERPLFGWGPENFYAAFNVFYKPESLLYSYYETWFDRAHNSVLDALSMNGVVGTVLYFGVFAAALLVIVRRVRAGTLTPFQGTLLFLLLGSYFFQNLFAFDALSGFLLFYLLLALIDAPPRDASEKHGAPLPTGVALLAAFPGAVVAIWFVLLNVHIWQANAASLLSIAALRAGALPQAAALHEEALAKGSPHAFEIRADFAREVGQLIGRVPPGGEEQALALLNTAFRDLQTNVRDGKDVFDSILLSQIITLAGGGQEALLAEAERVIMDAIPLSPKRQQLHYTLARIYLLEKRPADAVRVLEQVVRDEPRIGESHWLLALALQESGRETDAWTETFTAIENKYVWRNDDELGFLLSLQKKRATAEERSRIIAGLSRAGAADQLARYAESVAADGATGTAREAMAEAVRLAPTLLERATALWERIGAP